MQILYIQLEGDIVFLGLLKEETIVDQIGIKPYAFTTFLVSP